MSNATQTVQPWQKGWQFSLRALLIGMLVAAIFFAWLGYHMRRTAEQRATITWLKARGAKIGYQVEHDSRWLLFGRWIPEPVTLVRLDGAKTQLPIDDLSPLAALDKLSILRIENAQVSDLSPLAKLHNLQQVEILGAPVQDISPLGGLEQLTFLNLRGTQVSDLTPLRRLNGLRYLDLQGAPIAELSPLAQLPSLKHLALSSTHLTTFEPLTKLPASCFLFLQGPHHPAITQQDIETLRASRRHAMTIVLPPIWPRLVNPGSPAATNAAPSHGNASSEPSGSE